MKWHLGSGGNYSLFVLLLADATAALLAAVGVFAGRTAQPAGTVSIDAVLMHAVPLAAALVGVIAISGFYEPRTWISARRLAGCACVAIALMGFVSYALAEVVPFRARPQHEIWTTCLVYLITVAAFRLVLTAALRPAAVPAGAGYIGFPEVPNPAEVSVAQPGRRFQPVGPGPTILAVTALPSRRDAGNMHRDGAAEDTTSSAASPSARRSLPDGRPKKPVGRLVDLDTLSNDWITKTPIGREGWGSRVFRRSFDILGSLALLLAVLPLLLITALAIRLESRGPVFYRQERVGKDGRVFTLFKFRSMTVDAERDGPRWALPRDPRVTRVGRIIRLTRIDEVPQVFNVLRGEMALIGPRPERPAFVEQLAAVIPHYQSRSAVRPGITGWAQVNYPYGASVEDARNKLAFDLYYIQHRTVALDVLIVIGTIRVVIFQEGAR